MKGELCSKIIFLAYGKIKIQVTNMALEICDLDILQRGDIIGQYAFLMKSGFNFEAIALTDCKVFYLERSILEKFQSKIKGLSQALTFGVDLINEYGVPI